MVSVADPRAAQGAYSPETTGLAALGSPRGLAGCAGPAGAPNRRRPRAFSRRGRLATPPPQ